MKMKEAASGCILEVKSEWIQGTSEQAPAVETTMRRDRGTPVVHLLTNR